MVNVGSDQPAQIVTKLRQALCLMTLLSRGSNIWVLLLH